MTGHPSRLTTAAPGKSPFQGLSLRYLKGKKHREAEFPALPVSTKRGGIPLARLAFEPTMNLSGDQGESGTYLLRQNPIPATTPKQEAPAKRGATGASVLKSHHGGGHPPSSSYYEFLAFSVT